MSHQLKDVFDRNITINITPKLAQSTIYLVEAYETRGTNPTAFNTYMLGISPCAFKTSDRDSFFELYTVEPEKVTEVINNVANIGSKTVCGISNSDLNRYTHGIISDFLKNITMRGVTAGDVRKWINDSGVVNTNYAVISDPFNMFSVYMIHKFLSNTSNKLYYRAAFEILMLLQYKFFTSLVNFRFRYKPSEGAMTSTYENLTNKFDIKIYGTWKRVLEARTEQLLDAKSIHYNTLMKFDDDKAILYFITDVQTRLRNQINLFVEEFMNTKRTNDMIDSYSITSSDSEGVKIIVDNNEMFDSMTTNVYNNALSLTQFLDDTIIRIIAGPGRLFPTLNASTFRSLLVSFSEYAVKQSRARQADDVKLIDGSELAIGSRRLIGLIIQQSYRYCIQTNVDIHIPIKVLLAVKDIYSSSRISEPGIIQTKASVAHMLDNVSKITRESTLSALRIGFICYIIALSLKFTK